MHVFTSTLLLILGTIAFGQYLYSLGANGWGFELGLFASFCYLIGNATNK